VDNAAELISIAIEQKEIDGLEELKQNLEMLQKIVFLSSVDISLQQFEQLSDYEKFELLIKDSTEDTLAQNIKVNFLLFVGNNMVLTSSIVGESTDVCRKRSTM
jgi:hypothetical protein